MKRLFRNITAFIFGLALGTGIPVAFGGLENLTGTSVYIDDLVNTNPADGDSVSQAAAHMRGIKNVLLNTFPNITGSVTATQSELNIIDGVTATTAELNILDGLMPSQTELNYVNGVTSAIQTQIDGKQDSDQALTDISGLAVTNSNFIVGNGSNWVAESGATARASLGLVIDTDVAPASKGVTNGNSHNHVGGDGATIPYSGLSFSNNIVAGDIATDAVGSAEIAANAVNNSEMGDDAIGRAEQIWTDSVATSANTVIDGNSELLGEGMLNVYINSPGTGRTITLEINVDGTWGTVVSAADNGEAYWGSIYSTGSNVRVSASGGTCNYSYNRLD